MRRSTRSRKQYQPFDPSLCESDEEGEDLEMTREADELEEEDVPDTDDEDFIEDDDEEALSVLETLRSELHSRRENRERQIARYILEMEEEEEDETCEYEYDDESCDDESCDDESS